MKDLFTIEIEKDGNIQFIQQIFTEKDQVFNFASDILKNNPQLIAENIKIKQFIYKNNLNIIDNNS